MRKTTVLLSLVLIFLAAQSWASPDKSQWRRMTLLGTNQQHYYAYVVERENPGSYYEYTVRSQIEKYHIKTNRLITATIIRETSYSLPDPEKPKWTQVDKTLPSVDLGAYLKQENIDASFPETWKRDMGIAYTKGGLYLQRGTKKVLLRQLGASRLVEDEETRLASLFVNQGYAFLVVQQGHLNMDTDSVQKILPVAVKVYKKAVHDLFKDK